MRLLYLLILLPILFSVAQAQPNVVIVKDLIVIDAPSKVNVSESALIKIEAYLPEFEELGDLAGSPAGATKLTVSTTLGNLIEVNTTTGKLTNNSGMDIVVYTNTSGVALVQFVSNTSGKATITVNAPALSDLINALRGNESTAYLVMNTTEIEVVEMEVTPTTTQPTTTTVTTTTTTTVTTITTPTTVPTTTTPITTVITTPTTTTPLTITQPTPTTTVITTTTPTPGFETVLVITVLLLALLPRFRNK